MLTWLVMIDLSVVIVSWNTTDLLRDCLASLLAQGNAKELAIIVVDNASSDGTAAMVQREFPQVHLIRNDRNLGFARANNQGIRNSQGRFIMLLNSDTRTPSGSIRTLVEFMAGHPDAGVVGPRLVQPDGTVQAYGFGNDPTPGYLLRRGLSRLLLRRPLHDWQTDQIQRVDWVSGACLLARHAAVEQVGLLDEAMFMYYEDNDWCLRIRQAGWNIYYDPLVSVVHLRGRSLAQNPAAHQAYYRSLQVFYRKHYAPVARACLRIGLTVHRLIGKQ